MSAASGAVLLAAGVGLLWMRPTTSPSATAPAPATLQPSPDGQRSRGTPQDLAASGRPDLPLILHGICPGEGCRYEQWWAPTQMTVYASAGDASSVVATLEPGEPFTALGGQLSVIDPPTVRLSETCTIEDSAGAEAATVVLQQSELLWVLHPAGGGRYVVWHQGQVRTLSDFWSGAGAVCKGQLVSQGTAPTWWVQVRDKHGRTGWVVNPTGHALLEAPEAPEATVAAASSAVPAARAVPDPAAVALAKARRAQQEGRFTAPPGDCALGYIADALAAAPDNADAQRWIERFAQGVAAEASRLVAENRPDPALAYVDEVVAAVRTRPELSTLYDRLRQRRETLFRATHTFEMGHDHGGKLAARRGDSSDPGKDGCTGVFELTSSGFSFRTRESGDNRRDSVSVAARDIKGLELKDEDTRLRVKTVSQGTWSFVGAPDALRRAYDYLRERAALEER